MATVKYSGPVASFHCPTEATIRSLKVHFSPKQLGSGTPSPENIRPIEGWDGVELYDYTKTDVNTDIIPSEYKKVEYLESTGTQYINISNIRRQYMFDIVATIKSARTNGAMLSGFSLWNDSDATCIWQSSVYIGVSRKRDSQAHSALANASDMLNKKLRFICSTQNAILIDADTNTEIARNTDVVSDLQPFPVNLFHGESNGAYRSRYIPARVYSAKWYLDNTKVFDFIPCCRKSDDKPGMYDTVSGEFFTNQGTGEFICGPDVGQTTDYEFGVLGKNKFPAADGSTSDIFLAENTTYTLSNTSISEGYFKGWYEDGTNTGLIWINAGSDGNRYWKTFTPQKNIIKGLMYVGTGMSECQIELGTIATAYEPYDPNKTVYGGWVDLISGEVCEEKIKHIVASNGFYTSGRQASVGGVYFYKDIGGSLNTSTAPGQYAAYNSNELYSHGSPSNPYGDKSKNCGWIYKSSSTKSTVRLGFTDEMNITTVEELYNWIDNNENEISIVYPLETPNTYHLAPTQLRTFLGQNNIWSNADYVEVEYDLHETQSILARKQFIIANQPHVEKLAAAPLQNFVTDMVAPLKECKIHFTPIQEGEGDPSPDNVRAISGWTGVEVSYSQNLVIKENDNSAWTTGWVNTNGGINASSQYRTSDYIPVSNNDQFYLSFTAISNQNPWYGVSHYDSQKKFINRGSNAYVDNASFTISSSVAVAFIRISMDVATNIIIYKKPITTIPIDWSDSAGTVYGGYVDLVTGEVWETRICIDMGEFAQSHTKDGISDYLIRWKDPYNCDGPAISSHFKNNPSSNWNWMATNEGNYCQWKWGYIGISSSTLGFTTEEEWKNWLTNNDVKLVGNLSTPILITTLTPTQFKTLRGANNIWSNANGNIELSYWKH